MTDSLEKLRALDKAARQYATYPSETPMSDMVAMMRLYSLVHLLLPAMEALEKTACSHQQWYVSQGEKRITHEASCTSDKTCRTPCDRCTVLRQLEEALDDD